MDFLILLEINDLRTFSKEVLAEGKFLTQCIVPKGLHYFMLKSWPAELTFYYFLIFVSPYASLDLSNLSSSI